MQDLIGVHGAPGWVAFVIVNLEDQRSTPFDRTGEPDERKLWNPGQFGRLRLPELGSGLGTEKVPPIEVADLFTVDIELDGGAAIIFPEEPA